MGFRIQGIERNAIHRANLDTLRRIEMAHAFGAFCRVNHVVIYTLGNRLIGAYGLTHIAIDARVDDLEGQGQRVPDYTSGSLNRRHRAFWTSGQTNSDTSPLSRAISFTSDEEIKP